LLAVMLFQVLFNSQRFLERTLNHTPAMRGDQWGKYSQWRKPTMIPAVRCMTTTERPPSA
jgi:hypothetical protein